MVTILSLDGGGIRGVIPAAVLEEIEKRTGRAVCSMFDYIAGTSTGGIIACMLTVPGQNGRPRYTAREIKELYIKLGGSVFKRSLLRRIFTLGGLTDSKYSSKTLEKYLGRYLGGARMSAALAKVIIPAYETNRAKPWFFKSAFARPDSPDCDNPPMKTAARATSAAPTFFRPCRVGKNYCFIDGGLFANNPALCAYADARRAYPNERDFLVVSLGTGVDIVKYSYRQLEKLGLLEWAPPLINILSNSASATVDYQMRTLIGSERYFTFQVPLTRETGGMDNASRENIERLRVLAETLIRQKSGVIDQLCRILKERRPTLSGKSR